MHAADLAREASRLSHPAKGERRQPPRWGFETTTETSTTKMEMQKSHSMISGTLQQMANKISETCFKY
ncbi:hypothetical protein [Bradyrhizobium viridifuturi]|uniref:hypothetical protein n=1 Tax=Bradyrhizobium viridifuturi TaxID=1654716 RepID=UPI00067EE0CC|nr:hypothetical protein [Bradyrhizobium viridifuturi]